MMQILGLDTSNYTTSAALLDLEHGTVQQAKQLLPVKAGEAGLRQSDAVFHHTRQLPDMLEQLAPQMAAEELCAIGVSARPRNLEGSYMPCFLTGLGTARGIAAVTGVPLHVTSHQIGHVLAALYSAKKLELCRAPFLAFHVSGGTTDSLYCEPDAADFLRITPCGTSLDLKAGQAIDRVGLQLGLQFPCGAALEQLALQSRVSYKIKPSMQGANCSLSGVENQVDKRLQAGDAPADIARFVLSSVSAALQGMVQAVFAEYGQLPLLFAGGVMSNTILR